MDNFIANPRLLPNRRSLIGGPPQIGLRRETPLSLLPQQRSKRQKSAWPTTLTAKGRDLLPIVKAMRDWGLKWEPNTRTLSPPSKVAGR